jgi:hypothetical protein
MIEDKLLCYFYINNKISKCLITFLCYAVGIKCIFMVIYGNFMERKSFLLRYCMHVNWNYITLHVNFINYNLNLELHYSYNYFLKFNCNATVLRISWFNFSPALSLTFCQCPAEWKVSNVTLMLSSISHDYQLSSISCWLTFIDIEIDWNGTTKFLFIFCVAID